MFLFGSHKGIYFGYLVGWGGVGQGHLKARVFMENALRGRKKGEYGSAEVKHTKVRVLEFSLWELLEIP